MVLDRSKKRCLTMDHLKLRRYRKNLPLAISRLWKQEKQPRKPLAVSGACRIAEQPRSRTGPHKHQPIFIFLIFFIRRLRAAAFFFLRMTLGFS